MSIFKEIMKKHNLQSFVKTSDKANDKYNYLVIMHINSNITKPSDFAEDYARLLDNQFYTCATDLKKLYQSKQKLYQVIIEVADNRNKKYGKILAQMCSLSMLSRGITDMVKSYEFYKDVVKHMNKNIFVSLNIRTFQ